MNEIKTEISFNTAEKSSTISYWIDGVQTTTYTYMDGKITMSARSKKHNNSVATYVEGIDGLVTWLGKLKKLSPPIVPLSEYTLKLQYNDHVLHHKYYVNESGKGSNAKRKNKIMDACYYVDDKIVMFLPRPEISVNYTDFRMSLIHAKNFAIQIKNMERYAV